MVIDDIPPVPPPLLSNRIESTEEKVSMNDYEYEEVDDDDDDHDVESEYTEETVSEYEECCEIDFVSNRLQYNNTTQRL